MLAWLKSHLDSILLELGYVPRSQFNALVKSNKELNEYYDKFVLQTQDVYESNKTLNDTVSKYQEALNKAQESISLLTNELAQSSASRGPIQNPNLSNVSWPRLKKILERKDIQELKESSKLVQDPRNEEAKNQRFIKT